MPSLMVPDNKGEIVASILIFYNFYLCIFNHFRMFKKKGIITSVINNYYICEPCKTVPFNYWSGTGNVTSFPLTLHYGSVLFEY